MPRILRLTLLLLLLATSAKAQLSPASSSSGSITTNGSTCAVTNACVVLHMATSNVGYSVTISGTWTGTLTIEQSGDNQGSWTSATTTTSNTLYTSALTPGITDVRVRGSAAMTGAAVVTITASGPAVLQQITQAGGAAANYNVKSYGAKGDGVADDTAAIQAAISAFPVAPACGVLFFPPGTYKISSTIGITGRRGCGIVGSGDGQSASDNGSYITWAGTANGTMLSIAGCYECDVSRFTLDGASSAGVGIQYTSGGGLSSQQSNFHDLTILNITGNPGQDIYVGSATNAQVSESRFDRIFMITGVTGVRQEGINTLNVTYKDLSTAALTAYCFDIAAGNFRGIHNTCVMAVGATAVYNLASGVGSSDIIGSYSEGSDGPIVQALGSTSASSLINLVGNQFGVSAANSNFFNITTNGSLTLVGNLFTAGAAATASYGPVGLIGAGRIGILVSHNNTWGGVTLTPSGTAYATETNESNFTNPYSNVLSAFVASHISVMDSTNVQLYKSPLTFYDGTSRYNLNVANTGLQFTNSAGSIIGGFNTGNPATAANFEASNINATIFKLRNGATLDTGLSRDAAGVVDIGNGTTGNASGTWKGTYSQFVEAGNPGGVASSGFVGENNTDHTLHFNSNNNGDLSPSGAWSCTNVTPVTLPGTSTTGDQNLMACTIPAGTLNRVGRTLRVKAKGVYSTPAASVSQMTVKLKLCTVSGCGSGTVITPINIQSTALGTVQITNDNFSLRSEITTQTAGASSAYEASGEFLIDLATLTTAADSEFGDTNTATVGTIDSTAQLFLQTTIAFSVASASNVATQRQLIAETVN